MSAGFATCLSARIFPLGLCVMYTARIAPLWAFSLINSLNSTQRKQTEKRKKSRMISFLPPLLLIFLCSCSSRLIFSWLASLQGLFAFYLLMRCVLSFSTAPLPWPFRVSLTNSWIHVRKLGMCAGQCCSRGVWFCSELVLKLIFPMRHCVATNLSIFVSLRGMPESWRLQHGTHASVSCV